MAKSFILQLGHSLHRLPRHFWQASALLLGATAACGQAATRGEILFALGDGGPDRERAAVARCGAADRA